jgi:ABC-type uncharacterized transport system permease subunit
MPQFWLRVAVVLYGIGLVYALLILVRRSDLLGRIALHAAGLAMVFHFVSLTEAFAQERTLLLASVHNSESLLAFVVMVGFMLVYWRYQTTTPGVFVFPLVFLLTFVSAMGGQKIVLATPLVRNGWIIAHIVMIFTGYAALVLSFGASLLYLVGERALKSKRPGGMMGKLPPLETIDQIGYRSLLLGFPFMTLGLVAGSVVAQAKYGAVYFRDPKVLLSLLMWAVYVLMLYTRWNSGWRGRRAAYLATFAFLAAVVAWAANFFSGVHRFVSP